MDEYEYPTEVTASNWQQLEDQGFTWLTNMPWPPNPYELSIEEYWEILQRFRNDYGYENVMLGYPLKNNMPDESAGLGGRTIGLYVKSVRK